MTLLEFLRARLDEDERAAKDASPDGGREHAAYVLADVESKRRIVDDVIAECEAGMYDPQRGLYGKVLRSLARPYAHHPDYDPSWRP